MKGKTDFEVDCERGFLPIVDTRVSITGTRFNGSIGVVVETPEGWPRRAIAVQLDEWDHVQKFFHHQVLTEFFVPMPWTGGTHYP